MHMRFRLSWFDERATAGAPSRHVRATQRIAALATGGALALSVLATGSAAAAGGAPLYVAPGGSDSAACTQTQPCLTIGRAVSAAASGSTVVVEAGTYHEQVFVTKQLTLIGHHATIDAAGLLGGIKPLADLGIIGMGVLIAGPGAAGSQIQGFTVENAPAEGILVAMTSNVTIYANEVLNNDVGATSSFKPLPVECAEQGNVPGDCGEAVHLLSVTHSSAIANRVHDNVGGFLLTDEVGPTYGNLISVNVVRDNLLDCGITLPSHNANAMADPNKGGVYDNTVVGNISEGNGGAGVGMFAPFPGTASYNNVVMANTLRNNGEAGVAIHAHAAGQNVSGNVIVGNTLSGNGVDPDFVDMTTKIEIMIGSVAVPVTATVSNNRIFNEAVGIYRSGPVTVTGIDDNAIAPSVTTPIH